MAGRPVRETHRILKDGTAFIEKETSTAWWPDGKLKSKLLADGFATGVHLYDAGGRLRQIVNVAPPSAFERRRTSIEAIQYNLRGQTTLIEYGDGTTTTFTYNAARGWLERVKTMRGTEVLLDQSYARNDKGMITAIASPDPSSYRAYRYDGMDRLQFQYSRHRELSQLRL